MSIEGGDIIGRLLVIEFDETDSKVFDKIMEILKKYPFFERLQISDEAVLSFPNLEIRPERRKVYYEHREIHLTTKEFDIFCLLVANKGQIVTYDQVYQRVWGAFPAGKVNDIIGYHVRNLRKKLCKGSFLAIRCTREIGYYFEIELEKMQQSG